MQLTCVDRSPGSEAQVMNRWLTPPIEVRLQHSACVPRQLSSAAAHRRQYCGPVVNVNRSSPEL
jgi:hypothetical protein